MMQRVYELSAAQRDTVVELVTEQIRGIRRGVIATDAFEVEHLEEILHVLDRSESVENRRQRLGIPFHGDADHEWRSDDFCNCGARKSGTSDGGTLDRRRSTRGKVNLDVIERNGMSGDRG